MKRFLVLLIVSFFTVSLALGKDCKSGKQCSEIITAAATSCSGDDAVVLQLASNTGSATISVIGGFTATLAFEQSTDNGASWVGIKGMPQPTGAGVTGTAAAGAWRFGVAASTQHCDCYEDRQPK